MKYCVLAFALAFPILIGNQGECAGKTKKATREKTAVAGLQSSEPDRILASIKTIKRSKRAKDIKALEQRIQEGLPPEILVVAIDALAASGRPNTLKTLTELSTHRDEAVRKQIILALSKKKSNKTLKTLVELLDDHNREVRAEAVRAIGNLAPGPGMKYLISAAEQGLEEAGTAVGKKAQAREVKGLIRTINSKTVEPLSETLATLGSRQDLPHALKMSLIGKLEQIDTPISRAILTKLAVRLSKWDPIRLAAARALSKKVRSTKENKDSEKNSKSDSQKSKQQSKQPPEKTQSPGTTTAASPEKKEGQK